VIPRPADTALDERLWMACRRGGDVLVRWDDLTDADLSRRASQQALSTRTGDNTVPERILVNPKIPRGRVLVVEDGVLVADGRLADLVRVDGPEPENTDIYVNPADAEGFKSRWLPPRIQLDLDLPAGRVVVEHDGEVMGMGAIGNLDVIERSATTPGAVIRVHPDDVEALKAWQIAKQQSKRRLIDSFSERPAVALASP
jgi:hypothetical protein